MFRHVLCVHTGRGTPARHAVVGTVANRDISWAGDIGTVGLELDLFRDVDRDAVNALLQRACPANCERFVSCVSLSSSVVQLENAPSP